MKKSFIYIMLCPFSLLFMAMTCTDDDYYLEHNAHILFENRSGDSIYFIHDYGESPQNPFSAPEISEDLSEYHIQNIADSAQYHFYISKDYEEYLYLIIWKQSTMNKYSEKELVEKSVYDTLYTYSYSDLEKMNFKIIYTGE
ncbi:MAG: hypothetical protein IJ693_11585 [Bacteroidaceae bacterium]|nr:hypothetical protein [Bacteroidaceae bacterium]